MYEEHPSSDPADEGEEHTQQPLRRTSKRLQRNDEEELDYGAVSKRYKMEMSQSQYEMSYSRQTTPAVHYSPEVRPGNIDGTNSHTSNPHMPDRRNNSPYSHVMGMQVAPAPTHDGHGHALFKLLGQDMDAYVDSHMDAYEQARKKWSECSMDEWTTGADELAGKFTKMLDFVKDHMTSKLTLYASFITKYQHIVRFFLIEKIRSNKLEKAWSERGEM
ncbi:hypothetical protein A0H81_13695 [Grifola frondosa]|uniref:Uncharacterized protein n=1 Tax=Grifola frondosa TaxID=5627 RepID=A0A1C7LNT7_GRIFR|nr:hypothetical protein A0H81_13695 [Grifola frondosa]